MTKPTDLMTRAQDVPTVRPRFGEPIEREGVPVVPAARFTSGAGASSGNGPRTGAADRRTGSRRPRQQGTSQALLTRLDHTGQVSPVTGRASSTRRAATAHHGEPQL